MMKPRMSCFWLLRQAAWVAFNLALDRAGKSNPARMAMIAITTSSSMSVNADFVARSVVLEGSLPGIVGYMRDIYQGWRRESSVRLRAQLVRQGRSKNP